jgi:AraC-like DNA-binding protein
MSIDRLIPSRVGEAPVESTSSKAVAHAAGRGGPARASRPCVGGRTVAARAVARLIDIGIQAGVSRELLLSAAGVTELQLRDPDGRLPVAAEIALWQALARNVTDPGFGVRAGASQDLQQLGLLGYVAGFSATLRQALRRVHRYGRVFTDAVEFRFHEERPEIALALCHPELGPGHALAQDYRLAAVVQVARDLTRATIIPREVTLSYPRPYSIAAHQDHFGCPIRFDAPMASVAFVESDLDRRVVRADETLAGYLSGYAEHVLASLISGGSVRSAVRAAVWSLLGDGKPSITAVAEALRMPPRTLQRRLAAEGTSFHEETDEIRHRMAIAMLHDRSTPVEDVAFLLGYAEPSTFYRAFRRWTGTTPRQYRDNS